MEKIIIGTSESKLALWQAQYLKRLLQEIEVESELKIIKNKKHKIHPLTGDKIESKDSFTKEIEYAVLQEEADLVVHAMKKLPTTQPEGLIIGGVSKRANPHDVLIIKDSSVNQNLPLRCQENAIIGTSSFRRKAQLLHLRPDILIKESEGSIPARINKVREGFYDAIVIAAASIESLGIDTSGLFLTQLHHREFVPAPAQGVLAFQCHEENLFVRRILNKIHHPLVSACTNVERSVLRMVGGVESHLSLGVYCHRDQNDNYHCFAAYSEGIGKPLKKTNLSQSTTVGLAEKIYNDLTNG